MAITSVTVQTSVSVQSQAPPISTPNSATSSSPVIILSIALPSTGLLPTSSSMVLLPSKSPLTSSLMQLSTSFLPTSAPATPNFSPMVASIVQSVPSSSPQSVPSSSTTFSPAFSGQTTSGASASLTWQRVWQQLRYQGTKCLDQNTHISALVMGTFRF